MPHVSGGLTRKVASGAQPYWLEFQRTAATGDVAIYFLSGEDDWGRSDTLRDLNDSFRGLISRRMAACSYWTLAGGLASERAAAAIDLSEPRVLLSRFSDASPCGHRRTLATLGNRGESSHAPLDGQGGTDQVTARADLRRTGFTLREPTTEGWPSG